MPLHMRLPKLRGFANPFRVEYQVVNLARLAALFPEGGAVGPRPTWSPRVRSATASLSRCSATVSSPWPLQVSANGFSASAKEKIENAGGSVTEL